MSFIEKLAKNEKVTTENGATGYKTSSNVLVDLNFKVPSMRKDASNAFDDFDRAFDEDREHTLKWLLYLRDIKNGIGERDSFRDILLHLCYTNEKFGTRFVSLPLECFGRWDDYIYVAYYTNSTTVKSVILDKIANQLRHDLNNVEKHLPISLLAKWMCSANASSKDTRKIGRWLASNLGYTLKDYRKTLSNLRKYLDVVEVKMSSNEWHKIDYGKVPSKANLIYGNAFYEHDTSRREKYLDNLKNGEAKINANSMFLYDIVHKYMNNTDRYFYYGHPITYDDTLEALWKAQNKVEGFTDTLVVRDGSGSMTSYVSGNVSAMDIGDSITLYASENNKGAYKDKFVTFSSNPEVVNLSRCKNLKEKLEMLLKYNDCSNTDIYKVFKLVLDTAIKNKLSQDELPKQILIISDMEFDDMNNDFWGYSQHKLDKTLFEKISDMYEEYGYKLPKLIFWNVNSRTNAVPLQQNELGVILVSGFSKNIFDMVLSTELDPYKALIGVLDGGRYDCVKEIVAE